MGNVNGGFVPGDFIKLAVNLRLGNGVQGGGGFVQNDERGIFIQCPGNGDFLGFPAGNLHTIVGQILIKHRIQPLGQTLQTVPKPGIHQCLLRFLPVIVHAARHIAAQALAEQLEVLEHHGENGHVIIVAVLADVNAV